MIGKVCFIIDDLFGIAGSLKEIDSDYFVVYSYRKKRYEVHHRGQRGSSLAFVVPFDRLDARTLDYAKRTRRERAEEFIREMDRENLYRERQKREKAVAAAESKFEKAMN